MAKKKNGDDASETAPVVPTILLEGGEAIAVDLDFQQDVARGLQQFRVKGADGQWYDHCAEAPDGRWIYRHTDAR